MKNKTIILNIAFSVLITLSTFSAAGLPPRAAAIISAISACASILVKTIFPSGRIATWTLVTVWIVNLLTIVPQMITAIGTVVIISPIVLAYINNGVNVVILLINNSMNAAQNNVELPAAQRNPLDN